MNILCCLLAVFSKAKHTQVSPEDVAESERLTSNPNRIKEIIQGRKKEMKNQFAQFESRENKIECQKK